MELSQRLTDIYNRLHSMPVQGDQVFITGYCMQSIASIISELQQEEKSKEE